MTYSPKAALAAGLFLSAAAASVMPAAATAQVNGIATSDPAVAVAGSQALQTAYQQIGETYQAQRQTLEQRQQQRQQLVQQFDTNGDGQLDESEIAATRDANNANVQQIQALDREIQQIQGPIQRARAYAVQQVAQEYSNAVQQVVSDRGIQMMIVPDAISYAPESANVTQAVTDALNTRVSSVQTAPPEDWQPSESTVNLLQQVQQVYMLAAMQQQQQQPVQGR